MKKSILIIAALAMMFVACKKGDGGKTNPTISYGILSYGDLDYRTLDINGQTWMVDPLCYVPEGVNISEDPTTGEVFYPYTLKDYTFGESVTWFTAATQDSVKNIKHAVEGTPVVNLVKDVMGIRSQGLLYSWETVLGAAPTSDYENNKKFENCQGICPAGWHIPSEADWNTLIGEGGGYYYPAYKGGNITLMNLAGFIFTPSGTILSSNYQTNVIDKNNSIAYEGETVEVKKIEGYPETKLPYYQRTGAVESLWKGYPAITYNASSTAADPGKDKDGNVKPATTMRALMTTFGCSSFIYHEKDITAGNQTYPYGRLTVANGVFKGGAVTVRCVKNK